MRFQIKMFLSVFCLVLLGFLFVPVQDVAYAQLPQCTCDNSSDSTCADGFRVTFLGQIGNTFTYSICNEADDPFSDCSPTMALSHADIIIANPSCINDPGSDITTTIIGTDGSTRACDAPTNRDPACNVDNLNELLIKCDETAGVFTPGAGECVEIDIEIANTPGITVGPSISLNKAGSVCGSGCLLGPSCVGCVPPPTDPPPTDPPPTDPPPTDPPPTDPPPTDPPPTDPPPTDPPPTDPPPTDPPPTDPPPTDPPPTDPPPTDPPPTLPPVTTDGCCVEVPGVCGITQQSACSIPPNLEFRGLGTTCDNVAVCNVPPVTSVPTMSEWGLIATAVMLGLFSLITVRRGFKVNNK